MGKRYVFFRNDHGKKSTSDKHIPQHLLARIGQSSTKVEGGIGWSTFQVHQWEVALRATTIVIDGDGREMRGHDAWSIVLRAMRESCGAAPGQPISYKDMLERADSYAAEYFRLPDKPFILVTSLAVDKLPADSLSVMGCTISPLPNGRAALPFPKGVLSQVEHNSHGSHLESTSYLWIKVETTAKTDIAAVEKALNAVNFLRGIWTMLVSFRGSSFSVGGSPDTKSIAVVHLGPLHTLHNPDGSVTRSATTRTMSSTG